MHPQKARSFIYNSPIPPVTTFNLEHETKEQVVDILKQVGFVTDEIPASVAMERINTLAISNECIDKVKNAYDYIIQEGAIK